MLGLIYYYGNGFNGSKDVGKGSDTGTAVTSGVFERPKKSAHWESNTPEHGSTLADAPINIVIDFNFDLTPPSIISVTSASDGKDYAVGETAIDKNGLVLRRSFDHGAPDGLYSVKYTACWSATSCHEGNFQFAIDRKLKATYLDMRNKSEVGIKLSQISFKPANILISPGTKVTWTNDDPVAHTVNTDSHPGHTYFLNQNSRLLKKGESYSTLFEQAGAYPYHCSPHAESMKGTIIVE